MKAFGGKGVRLGDDVPTHRTTMTGLKKKVPKVKSNWRCLKCFNVNSGDGPECRKCSAPRDGKAPVKEERKEEIPATDALTDENSLEEEREDILDLLSELKVEANDLFPYCIKKI